MQEIPLPAVLDDEGLIIPENDDMTAEDHRGRAETALTRLRQTSEYGKLLREELAAVGTYLETAVPASKDPAAWAAWQTVYGSVLSSLAGPKGDNGFGAQEAARIAEEHGAR